MRILFVIKSLSAAAGGAERVLTTISSALADRGLDVAVATFDGPEGTDFYHVSDRVERLRLGVGDTKSPTNGVEFFKRVRALRSLVAEYRPNVAFGFMHSSFVPLSVAVLGKGVPVIACERIAWDYYRSRWLDSLAFRASSFLVAKVTVNGAAALQSFPRRVRHKMAVIPNPVRQPAEFADVRGSPPRVVLTVGRLTAQKDHELLIRAFKTVEHRDGWRLRIVGSGELRARLLDVIDELELGSAVEIIEPMKSIEAEYLNAQLFVLPSRYEAFPNSLAEALAHGLPAIGFADCVGTNDLIISGLNGLLVDGGDRIANLAAALQGLISSAQLRMKLAAAAPASVRHYTLESIVNRWEALLHSVATEKGEAQ